ncbi:hypothetical protein EN989_31115, partial [Mesorhizobium sp. M7A.F.Ca.CA.002.12.1.1]
SRGRSTVPPAFASSQMLKEKVSPVTQPISPLEGEMSGRTEGGAVPPALPIGRSPPNPYFVSPIRSALSRLS